MTERGIYKEEKFNFKKITQIRPYLKGDCSKNSMHFFFTTEKCSLNLENPNLGKTFTCFCCLLFHSIRGGTEVRFFFFFFAFVFFKSTSILF